ITPGAASKPSLPANRRSPLPCRRRLLHYCQTPRPGGFRMSVPPADRPPKDSTLRRVEEVDVWWGSYAGRAMLPSFAVCTVLTALISFVTHWWVHERGWLQLNFFGLAGAVWLVQLTRWGRRFFTWNYRLTTRWLYVDRGHWPLKAQRFEVRNVARVE